MELLSRFTLVLAAVLLFNSQANSSPAERDRRFIFVGDTNIGFAVSVGGSIGSGIISSSKFKGRRSFTTKHCHVKKRRLRHQHNDYGPMWLPWWSPPPPHY